MAGKSPTKSRERSIYPQRTTIGTLLSLCSLISVWSRPGGVMHVRTFTVGLGQTLIQVISLCTYTWWPSWVPNLGPIHTPAGHLTVPNPTTSQEIERTLQERSMPDTDVTNMWEALRQTYLEALEHKIPKRKQLPRKPWITEDTLKLLMQGNRGFGKGRTRGHGLTNSLLQETGGPQPTLTNLFEVPLFVCTQGTAGTTSAKERYSIC